MSRGSSAFDALADLSSPLRVPASERSYGRQFAQMYDYRLAVLRRRVLAAAAVERGAPPPYIERILDIPPRQVCFVIGTLYASMQLKPDVLQEIARDVRVAAVFLTQQSLPAPAARPSYVGDDDRLFIEDQSGRVRLVGDLVCPGAPLTRHLATGVVVGVYGIETPEGDFEVASMHFAGLPPPIKPPSTPPASSGPLVALVSGLHAGAADAPHDIHLELLCEWLTGELGSPAERADVARITSLVLAGNAVSRAWEPAPASLERKKNPFATLDPLLEQLCASLDAVVMLPGSDDPTSATLPQQPLLLPLLPRSSRWDSLHCVTNPTWCSLHGRNVLATSGQNIDDLLRYLPAEQQDASAPLDLALATLRWAHVAPSAPDTLWCYPFKATDPFIIRAAPDVYVVGNQRAFGTTTMDVTLDDQQTHTVRVVLVPAFSETHQIILLDPATLAVRVVSLAVDTQP